MQEILQGIKVVDLTAVVMGPYCTMHLADLGAEVIKVETKTGDSTRHIGASTTDGMGSLHLHLNRNKKSIVLDLKSQSGIEEMRQLIADADVFVHSLRPQAIERLGLSYDVIKEINQAIVYCGMYGYSKSGPYGQRPAYDDIIQAASGVAATQGEMTGEPQYLATLMGDKTAGIVGVYAIIAALFHRERTGKGQEVEVPMFETLVSFNMIEHLYGRTFVPALDDAYYSRAVSPYRKPYRTRDGYISILIYNDAHWQAFFEITGRDDLKKDERFENITKRTEHIDYVYQTVEGIIAEKTTVEWIDILQETDIPFTKINTPDDLLEDVHLNETNFFERIDHPTEGSIIQMKHPVNFSETPVNRMTPAPKLGEHQGTQFTEKTR